MRKFGDVKFWLKILRVFVIFLSLCFQTNQAVRAQDNLAEDVIPESPSESPSESESAAEDAKTFDTYKIQVGDVVGVMVAPATELSQECLVHPDGQITMGLVGNLRAQGLTPKELAQILQEK